ncbi:MAG TPA: DUF4956 domain-containing protein [Gemmatimonadaceae bacterium]|jgi:hypothetical protein|nr:DUF4956 domain-containing protein [Gemmatimonadaceae bacterium]
MHLSFKRAIDTVTLGSDRPIRRLLAYYIIVGGVFAALLYFFPVTRQLFSGERLEELTSAPMVLEDGLTAGQLQAPPAELPSSVKLAITTALSLVATLVLMLPVTWVYMSARRTRRHNQSVVETLIILPIVVAAIVLIVRNSLALAFSLAGVVAAVRFRTNLRDTRDTVFIFLAIGVGFAAGVQVITVGAIASILFNLVLLFIWRYDFGRNALAPTAASQHWAEPLKLLAETNGNGNGHGGVHDRDLVLALTPQKVDALADRFNRVRQIVGTKKKKPRFNALVSLTTEEPHAIQPAVEAALDRFTKRWKLDEITTPEGKPAELCYLVKLRKSMPGDTLLLELRAAAGEKLLACDLERSDALEQEAEEAQVAGVTT